MLPDADTRVPHFADWTVPDYVPAERLERPDEDMGFERLATLREPACQAAVAQVVENTIFNLLQEAAHGEFRLDAVPKRVVKISSFRDGEEGEYDC